MDGAAFTQNGTHPYRAPTHTTTPVGGTPCGCPMVGVSLRHPGGIDNAHLASHHALPRTKAYPTPPNIVAVSHAGTRWPR